MNIKSKKYSTRNFHCESGIDLNNLSQWFKEEMVFTYLPDGIYYGKTGLIELKEGKNGPRLIVNVSLKDHNGMNFALKYSTQFSPKNYFLQRLFMDFEVDLDDYPINLESLAEVYVEATVRNNGSYCNVVDMIPLDEEQIKNFINKHQMNTLNLDSNHSESSTSTEEVDDDLDLGFNELEDNALDEELEDFMFEEEDEL